MNVFLIVLFLSCASITYGYDPLDPNGNITITWDVIQENGDKQDVRLSIVNYQLFRHVELPGWKLSWTWPGDQVIWNMFGAESTEQGNCSAFKGGPLPHCCMKEPVIVDLLPGAPYNMQTANCCRGGVLSSMLQDPTKHVSVFQMNIGGVSNVKGSKSVIPGNFTLGLRGYTCGQPFQVPPTKFFQDQGRRRTQAFETWNVTCSYSQFVASTAPTCCVSLSAFYNETIVPCPTCSCACRDQAGSQCLNKARDLPPVLQQLPNNQPLNPVLQCTDFMCPIKVHWHVKTSYKEYWRVKITITNLNYVKNFSDWSLVVAHPNLSNITRIFSFNYKPLDVYGNINDTGMFYGIQTYNDLLVQSGPMGNVQTEMILHKDPGIFTFRQGWAFPRKISFNGDECVMPPPDQYPRLPNAAGHFSAPSALLIFSVLLVSLVIFYRPVKSII